MHVGMCACVRPCVWDCGHACGYVRMHASVRAHVGMRLGIWARVRPCVDVLCVYDQGA